MAKVTRLEGDSDVMTEMSEPTDETLKRKSPGKPPNHVLLLTIVNPYYPINVNVIYSICKRFGDVVRIVIFRKNGVQAMVEFESVEIAEKARSELDEKDIYSGCCRLKVEFAKPTKLNVLRNTAETWDYTKDPSVDGSSEVTTQQAASLLPCPAAVNAEATNEEYYGVKVKPEDEENIPVTLPVPMAYPTVDYYEPVLIKAYEEYDYGSVVMAYNLDEYQMNPDGLFNLFCMYGNVWKVKFLKSKKGCAMVQMGDRQGAERCLMYLQGLPLFGDKLQLGISKQAFLGDMGRGFELPDGTNSWKDFSNSKNNRFLTPEMASKNRLNQPSKVLHFFNMPPSLTEERLETFILNTAQISLVDLTVFPNKSDKSSSGLMEFESVVEAVTCIVFCNNVPMLAHDNSGPPYFIKLCFSSVQSIAVAEKEYEKRNAKFDKTDWL